MNAICITKCYWRDRLWRPGETAKISESEIENLPRHFAPLEAPVKAVQTKEPVDKEPVAEKSAPAKAGKK